MFSLVFGQFLIKTGVDVFHRLETLEELWGGFYEFWLGLTIVGMEVGLFEGALLLDLRTVLVGFSVSEDGLGLEGAFPLESYILAFGVIFVIGTLTSRTQVNDILPSILFGFSLAWGLTHDIFLVLMRLFHQRIERSCDLS
jgi:hypothetical protein